MTNPIPVDLVITFEHLKQWLEEVEYFAITIPKVDARWSHARLILERTAAIRIAAWRNNDVGLWRDDNISKLMLECVAFRSEAVDIATLTQKNMASRAGSIARKEKAAKKFDRETFLIDGAAMKIKHPDWSNSAIATHLAGKYNRAPGYLSKLLPTKK